MRPAEARTIQETLRAHLACIPLACSPRTLGGADVAYSKDMERLCAAVVVLDAGTIPYSTMHMHAALSRFHTSLVYLPSGRGLPFYGPSTVLPNRLISSFLMATAHFIQGRLALPLTWAYLWTFRL